MRTCNFTYLARGPWGNLCGMRLKQVVYVLCHLFLQDSRKSRNDPNSWINDALHLFNYIWNVVGVYIWYIYVYMMFVFVYIYISVWRGDFLMAIPFVCVRPVIRSFVRGFRTISDKPQRINHPYFNIINWFVTRHPVLEWLLSTFHWNPVLPWPRRGALVHFQTPLWISGRWLVEQFWHISGHPAQGGDLKFHGWIHHGTSQPRLTVGQTPLKLRVFMLSDWLSSFRIFLGKLFLRLTSH